MSVQSIRTLPHLIKPVTLLLLILQFFSFIAPYRSFGWFAITTTIVMFLFSLAVTGIFFFEIPAFVTAPLWPTVEMAFAAVFTVFSILDAIYYICNMFGHFNFFYLWGVVTSVLLVLSWGLDTLQYFKLRSSPSSMSSSSYPTQNNQATAAPPVGVNPA